MHNEATKEIIYTLRINGNEFSPKVFEDAFYTIIVGEGDNIQTYKGYKITNDSFEVINVKIDIDD